MKKNPINISAVAAGDGTILVYILYSNGEMTVTRERPQKYKIGDTTFVAEPDCYCGKAGDCDCAEMAQNEERI